MPIKIDNQLPARHSLELENIFIMTESRALTQDIRPAENPDSKPDADQN